MAVPDRLRRKISSTATVSTPPKKMLPRTRSMADVMYVVSS